MSLLFLRVVGVSGFRTKGLVRLIRLRKLKFSAEGGRGVQDLKDAGFSCQKTTSESESAWSEMSGDVMMRIPPAQTRSLCSIIRRSLS